MRAIIDRIEDGIAVLELYDREILQIPSHHLPGTAEGDVIDFSLDENGNILNFKVDRAETELRKQAAQSRLKRLFNK